MGLSAGVVYVSEPNVGFEVASALGLVQGSALPKPHSDPGFALEDSVRIATCGGWSIVMGDSGTFIPRLEMLSSALSTVSARRKVFCWVTQSTSGAVFFELHENGAPRRKWMEAEGQLFLEEGEPLPEENGFVDAEGHEGGPLHDEWSVLKLAHALVGMSEDSHFDLEGVVYAAAPAP